MKQKPNSTVEKEQSFNLMTWFSRLNEWLRISPIIQSEKISKMLANPELREQLLEIIELERKFYSTGDPDVKKELEKKQKKANFKLKRVGESEGVEV